MSRAIKLHWVILIAFVCIGFSLFFHFSESSDSMLNDKSWHVSEDYLKQAIDLHETDITFARRPLTNWGIRGLISLTGLTPGISFIVFNYLSYFVSGVLLFFLSIRLGANQKQGIINMVVYFLCFSNLFAFFPPIYSYDDPLQFTLLMAALLALFSKKWIPFIFLFAAATIAREGSVILLPGIFLFLQPFLFKDSAPFFSFRSLLRGGYFAIPIVLYVIFIMVFIHYNEFELMNESAAQERFSHFKLNFNDPANAIESFISIYLILGVPTYFLSLHKNAFEDPKYGSFIKAFVLTAIVNTLIVVLLTKARESRLLVIPLFLLWPIFAQLFTSQIRLFLNWSAYKNAFNSWLVILLFVFLIFLSNVFCHKVFISTAGGDDYFSGYLFFTNAIILLHLFLYHGSSKAVSSRSENL